ncbi:hypothetical protein C7Y66_26005 [Chroococcidiopsis sp. CCALA 051]|uniref:WD40 domain-containing protein n=1 Tax=Chroococcidiopsis sp. CCALA 051 TaxID=869949 RepID=UPI000D0CD9E4|nr:caspase family protein [Chroococcidiopsis sp. CCALA 051]PSM46254.1 hypothetical protein C7Y66_26005 [Chroococcidiopsis sp. CCALA 051]
MARVALLIGVSDYGPGFNWLPGVGKDLVAMQRVLQHPEMGGFTEVEILKNPDPLTMQLAIATLFNAQTRQPDDLVLLYFSGHHVSDRYGRFYFPTRLTCKNPNGELVAPTAIPSHLIKNIMNDSPAEQQVVILDCCADNSTVIDGWTQNPMIGNLQQQLGGIGRVILTAGNTATECSHKGFELSTYTHYLVEGIETGAADLDRDRTISVAEMHQYIRRRLGETSTNLAPNIHAFDDPQQIYLAKATIRRTALWWLENATLNTAIVAHSKGTDDRGTDWEADRQSTVAVLTSEMQEKTVEDDLVQRQPKSWLGAVTLTVLAILGIAYGATRWQDLRQLSMSETIAADTTYNHQVPTVLEHVHTVWSLAFSPDSQILASCGNDRAIKLWSLKTGELIRTILDAHAGAIWSVAIDPGGDKLISGSSDRTIKVWDLQTGEPIRTLRGHTDTVRAVAVSPDDKHIVSGSSDRTIKVWDLSTGVLLRTLSGHTSAVRAVAISPNGYTIVSGGADNLVRVWNLNTGQLLSTLQGHTSRVIAIAMSPDGNIVASGGNDNTIRLWNLQTGDLLHTLKGHSDHINSLTFRADGQVLISGAEDHSIKLWNPRSGELLNTLSKHDEDVYAVAISPDGKTLASADKAGEIKLGQ